MSVALVIDSEVVSVLGTFSSSSVVVSKSEGLYGYSLSLRAVQLILLVAQLAWWEQAIRSWSAGSYWWCEQGFVQPRSPCSARTHLLVISIILVHRSGAFAGHTSIDQSINHHKIRAILFCSRVELLYKSCLKRAHQSNYYY